MPAPARWITLVRLAALVALVTSALLYVDYTSYSPSFCASGSGCEEVRQSGFGYVRGVPVPVLGLIGFGLLFGATLWPNPRHRRLLTALCAWGGGVGALGMIGLMTYIGAYCGFCIVVDAAGIVAALAGIMVWRSDPDALMQGGLHGLAWLALGVVAVVSPILWPNVRPQPPLPDSLKAYYEPGKINVIQFSDFQCPHCRRLHFELKRILKDYDGRLNYVRMNMPLRGHRLAEPAARAAVCAEQQGKGDAMADVLYRELPTLDTARETAEKLGLDLGRYEQCLEHPDTRARIEREASVLPRETFRGLPTTYVGAEEIVGAQSESAFRASLDRAARGEGERGVPAAAYLAGLALLAGGIVFAGRARPPEGRAARRRAKKS
jgi:predicted DsbA family dithiol-disulfide isomerase/uncharacterized membrane protein